MPRMGRVRHPASAWIAPCISTNDSLQATVKCAVVRRQLIVRHQWIVEFDLPLAVVVYPAQSCRIGDTCVRVMAIVKMLSDKPAKMLTLA